MFLLQQAVLYKGGLLTHMATVIMQRGSRDLFTALDEGKFIFTALGCLFSDDNIFIPTVSQLDWIFHYIHIKITGYP